MKCCQISPAQLNRRVELQELIKTPTPTGGFTQVWVKVADLWAGIKNTSGSELLHADQLGAVAFSNFTIRYRSNINEVMRLIYRGTEYQIRHIDNVEEADRWIIVKAKRGVSQ